MSTSSSFKTGLKVKVAQSCPTTCNSMDCTVHRILQARILEWVAFLFSRGSSQAQGSNSGFPHCRQILYQLSHKGSPRILEWVAYPFSSGSSWPRNWTGVSCIGHPLQYSCLENPMDGGAWWATVHGVTKSRTRLSNFTSYPRHNLVSVCGPY